MSMNNCVPHGGMSTVPGCAQCKAEAENARLRAEFEIYKERCERGSAIIFERAVVAELQNREMRRDFDSIVIRCTEGDKRTDWLPIIAGIAQKWPAEKRICDCGLPITQAVHICRPAAALPEEIKRKSPPYIYICTGCYKEVPENVPCPRCDRFCIKCGIKVESTAHVYSCTGTGSPPGPIQGPRGLRGV